MEENTGIQIEIYPIDRTKDAALTTARKYLEEYILEQYSNAQIKYYNTAKECLVAINNEETNY